MKINILNAFFICITVFSCNQDRDRNTPFTNALEYISKNDPYFKERLKDTVYLYSQNHDYISSEISTGHYHIVGEDWQSPTGKLEFNQLTPVEFDSKMVLESLSKYIPKKKIVVIEKFEELEYYQNILNNQKQYAVPNKWLFTVNNLRKNKKNGIFQILYQANTRIVLGCVFIYDFEKNEIATQACEFPYKEPKD